MTVTRALDGTLTLEFADLEDLRAILRGLNEAAYAKRLTYTVPEAPSEGARACTGEPHTALDTRFTRQRG